MAVSQFLNRKGQTSFEAILIAVLVIAMSAFVLGNYFELKDSTTALSLLKIDLVNELNKEPEYYQINNIEFVETGPTAIDFVVYTEPGDLALEVAVIDDLKQKIASETKYEEANITITLNPP